MLRFNYLPKKFNVYFEQISNTESRKFQVKTKNRQFVLVDCNQ